MQRGNKILDNFREMVVFLAYDLNPSTSGPKIIAMPACLRAGCTNAQLTIWLANRGLTLTAQLTRCRVARSAVN